MALRALAVTMLMLLLVRGSSGADDITIMGLMESSAVRADSRRALTSLTGRCQKKHQRMQCHLNEIVVNKLDTTLFDAKVKEVLEQRKRNKKVAIKPRLPRLTVLHFDLCSPT